MLMKILKVFTHRIILYAAVFLLGGIGYGLIEIIFRGYTHWSMILTGGACFMTLCLINTRITNTGLIAQAFIGAVVITTYELLVGCIVNLWLKLDVWDYSDRAFSFYGQICPMFSFIWFLLALCLAIVSRLLYNMKHN